jgi:methylenetetrahydrofolate dehydrogenase (NADP+)/methenyltetrahydrofolate cyclohydrolase
MVGRSNLVGEPQAQLLERNAPVTICHSRTRDLAAVCCRADVVVAAAGVPRMLGSDGIKPGPTVIDVGMHRTPGGLCGDVDTDAVRVVAGAITPVPGGVGPMTVTMLLRNTVTAAQGVAGGRGRYPIRLARPGPGVVARVSGSRVPARRTRPGSRSRSPCRPA